MNSLKTKLEPVTELVPSREFCLDLAEGGHWYGHGFAQEQPYPLDTGQ